MLLDNNALFSDQQDITVSAPSTNHIDLGEAGTPPYAPAPVKQDLGGAQMHTILAQVTETFVGGTSVQVDMEFSTDAAFTAPVTVFGSGAVPVAQLVAGKQFGLACIPPGADLRYVRLNYTVVGGTAGKIHAGFVAGLQTNG